MNPPGRFGHFLIVGGGASGVLMAAHLLRYASVRRVTLIETSKLLGCGIAYATDNPDHLLNTRVHNMSAFPEDPEHFLRWLHASQEAPSATPDCFVKRLAYGRYLGSLVADQTEERLHCIRGHCVGLEKTVTGIDACLEDGSRIGADAAIIATGYHIPSETANGLRNGWNFSQPQDRNQDVIVVGTGLSMVDYVISLIKRDHRGRITCISRRGLLPREHKKVSALAYERKDIPMGAPVSHVLQWLRQQINLPGAEGATWRDAVDGLRPHVSAIWMNWTLDERRRFLRHAAPWWEVHRHRMPPQSAALLSQAQASGQLDIVKARFDRIVSEGPPTAIAITAPGGDKTTLTGHVVDCRGIRRDPRSGRGKLVLDLLEQGLARVDPLGLGLDTTENASLIDKTGQPSDRLFAIGPCARGSLWEITAIPDIRVQCARLAASLAA